MSAACCGGEPEEPRGIALLPVGLKPAAPAAHTSGDACCGPDEHHDSGDGEDQVDHEEHGVPPIYRDRALLLPALSGLALLTGYVLLWSGLEVASLIVHAAGLAAAAWTFVPGALRRLVRGRLGVALLMTIAAAGAVALGHIAEAAALAFLFSIAEALEDRAMDKAKDGLRALLDLIPDTARVSRLAGEVDIPAAELRELDVLVVRPGERVATDGVVVSGTSSMDTAAVTGESIPVDVRPGSAVLAGSINGGGALQIEATADGRDNSLTTIVRLVEEAHARKGERARLADRIASPLVPAVLIFAALIVGFGFVVGDPLLWTERALVVLVAASPCALALAVPVTVISAIGSASKMGVIIKSGEAFEALGAVRSIVLDKTGTLTRNEPRVVDVVTTNGVNRDEALAIAAALEAQSTHPLAAAIAAAAAGRTMGASEVQELPGHGLEGVIDGRRVQVGSPRWIDLGPLREQAEQLEAAGMTVVAVAIDGTIAAAIGIRDELRPEAAEAVQQLQRAGIGTAMLTGDNRRTAAAIAQQAGIREVRAEQLPQDKAAAIAELSTGRGTVAMVGDGINDAPALAAADVGIAMGATGSAAAVESANVALTGTDLRALPRAIAHARRARAIMGQNIVLSLAIIIVLMPLALFGVLGLAAVVLVHELAEVLVIANGMRAARRRQAA